MSIQKYAFGGDSFSAVLWKWWAFPLRTAIKIDRYIHRLYEMKNHRLISPNMDGFNSGRAVQVCGGIWNTKNGTIRHSCGAQMALFYRTDDLYLFACMEDDCQHLHEYVIVVKLGSKWKKLQTLKGNTESELIARMKELQEKLRLMDKETHLLKKTSANYYK